MIRLERPEIQLDTPFGPVDVTVQTATSVYLEAGRPMSRSTGGILVNRVLYRLSLNLRREPGGWIPVNGNGYYALRRITPRRGMDDSPSRAAVERAVSVVTLLFEQWASRAPETFARAEKTALEELLAREEEHVRTALARLREAEAGRDEVLARLGRPPGQRAEMR